MKRSGIYEKLAAELKAEDSKTYKPISSSRRPALMMGLVGVGLGVLLIMTGIGMWATQGISSFMSHLGAPSSSQVARAVDVKPVIAKANIEKPAITKSTHRSKTHAKVHHSKHVRKHHTSG